MASESSRVTCVKLGYGNAGYSRRPSLLRPLCIARQKCALLQLPMPALSSGVRLLE